MFLYCSIIDTYLILRLFTCFRTNIFLHWYLLLRINKYEKIYLSDFYFWVWLLKNDPFSSGFDRSLWALLLNISNKLLFIYGLVPMKNLPRSRLTSSCGRKSPAPVTYLLLDFQYCCRPSVCCCALNVICHILYYFKK